MSNNTRMKKQSKANFLAQLASSTVLKRPSTGVVWCISREESAVLSAGVGAFVVDDEHAEPNVGTPAWPRTCKIQEEKQEESWTKAGRHDGGCVNTSGNVKTVAHGT